jgi:hypothetical protein
MRMKNSFRVILTLEHIQRSIAVEVSGDDLEPVGGVDLSAVHLSRA